MIGMALACVHTVQAEDDQLQDVDAHVRRLLSSERAEREGALEELTRQSHATRNELAARVLKEAARMHWEDRRYKSPVHCAILAIDALRVFEAEDSLLMIIEYELDPASLPVGLVVYGDYFYPAASALTRLRIDARKVLDAMIAMPNEDERRLRLLTWVLAARTGSLDATKKSLEGPSRHENIRRASQFLESAENASDLLPRVTPRVDPTTREPPK
jgi:hypothetical protein